MKLAVISPLKCLDVIGRTHLSYHMALGQWLVKDYLYREWYWQAHLRGDFIIVDNGAAEPEDERMPFELIARAARKIGADEVVLPDVLGDMFGTLGNFKNPHFLSLVPDNKRVFVPQGATLHEWKQCLTEAIRSQIRFATIGVPKHLEKLKGGRQEALEFIAKMGLHQTHNVHMFGIYDNPRTELTGIPHWVRGIDTAAPIAYAQQGYRISNAPHCSLEWLAPADDRLVEANIYDLKEFANANEREYAHSNQ